MGERSSPIRSSAPHFWQRSPRQLRLRFANYVLTFLDLKKKEKVEQEEVLAQGVGGGAAGGNCFHVLQVSTHGAHIT